jgi:hypothetical protein
MIENGGSRRLLMIAPDKWTMYRGEKGVLADFSNFGKFLHKDDCRVNTIVGGYPASGTGSGIALTRILPGFESRPTKT